MNRTIRCLPIIYIIITSCLTNKIVNHIEKHDLLAEEQKGCRRNHEGCKDQLIVNSTVLKHTQIKSRNLNITYIDYFYIFSEYHDKLENHTPISNRQCKTNNR